MLRLDTHEAKLHRKLIISTIFVEFLNSQKINETKKKCDNFQNFQVSGNQNETVNVGHNDRVTEQRGNQKFS